MKPPLKITTLAGLVLMAMTGCGAASTRANAQVWRLYDGSDRVVATVVIDSSNAHWTAMVAQVDNSGENGRAIECFNPGVGAVQVEHIEGGGLFINFNPGVSDNNIVIMDSAGGYQWGHADIAGFHSGGMAVLAPGGA